MHESWVMTLMAEDRPGLIGHIAEAVAEVQGNWLDSRLVRLAGRFAGVVHAQIPSEQADTLKQKLDALKDAQGIEIIVQTNAVEPQQQLIGIHLELVGHDRPGIVRDISIALAQAHVNVLELTTETFSAPMTGETMFKAVAELHLPEQLSASQLEDQLEAIAEQLHLDLELDATST